jgi:hypothetical protein
MRAVARRRRQEVPFMCLEQGMVNDSEPHLFPETLNKKDIGGRMEARSPIERKRML